MNFLETITAWGHDVLVPIKDIKLIWIKYGEDGGEIHIKGDGEYEWVEYFRREDDDKLTARYEMIKNILGVTKGKKK